MSLLEVRNLKVRFDTVDGPVEAVRGLDFFLEEGEILGVVGETGSGKSVSCKALTRLLPDNAVIDGEVLYNGTNLLKLPPRNLRTVRGDSLSMIFQDPQSCLNPIKTIESHMKEVLIRHGQKSGFHKTAKDRLKALHIKSPGKRLKDYPFQFSGGMAQRVQIAMATTGHPAVMIADEPTTALDVTIQARILGELKALSQKEKLAVILITHDLSVVAEICDRVLVLYHGRIVESGPVESLLHHPAHPYTRALLDSVPALGAAGTRLKPIAPDTGGDKNLNGCSFAPRCGFVRGDCRLAFPSPEYSGERMVRCFHPLLSAGESADDSGKLPMSSLNDTQADPKKTPEPSEDILFEANNLVCRFRLKSIENPWLQAVDEVSLRVRRGEILGIVGESGSGKSTLAKAAMGLITPYSGTMKYRGTPYYGSNWDFKAHCRRTQYVFQDPLGALDPRIPILSQCAEPIFIHEHNPERSEAKKRAAAMLRRCGLEEEFHLRKPYNLSGGQRQRAVLARSLILNPEFLICDEPVSAMDVSVQAQIINLLKDLAAEEGLTILFISHDLSVVSVICRRVAVMYAGRIVEIGRMEDLFNNPSHPYTRLLINSIPGKSSREKAAGNSPDKKISEESDLYSNGCPFASRCPEEQKVCRENRPVLKNIASFHQAACHER